MTYGFNHCKFDPIVMRKTTLVGCVMLAIYVDAILFTSIYEVRFSATKDYLQMYFVTCDLKRP